MGIREELKRDLVEPLRTFTEEVYGDTVGDAKRFYSAQAKNMKRSIKLADQRAKEKAAAVRREQEEMRKHRKEMMKRASIVLVVLILLVLVIVSLVLRHGL